MTAEISETIIARKLGLSISDRALVFKIKIPLLRTQRKFVTLMSHAHFAHKPRKTGAHSFEARKTNLTEMYLVSSIPID